MPSIKPWQTMNSSTSTTYIRQFLAWALIAVLCAGTLLVAPKVEAAKKKDWRQVLLDRDRWLSLERGSTGEKAVFRYYRYGVGFESRGYAIANLLLRDVESGVTTKMDARLIDLLYLMQAWLRVNNLPHHIIINSGYRTPEYNARVKGSAKNSEHVKGTAADIRIPGLKVEDLNRLALAIGVGGVGFYPDRLGFIHVDVGRIRKWKG